MAMSSTSTSGPGGTAETSDPNPPTIAAFSPPSASPVSRSSFQVHQKSPLLVATPPRITQALSRAYPLISTADFVMGLLTWTSKDPWESFLLVAAFWAVGLYGDFVVKWGGNLLAVVGLIAGMFFRRYRAAPTGTTLDQILDTVNSLNARIEIFTSPFSTLLNILSTGGKSATRATTRPALTALFIRILLITPLWLMLAVWPFHIITPRRVLLCAGTVLLSWHSRPAKVSRTITWRSQFVRTAAEYVTGLTFTPHISPPPLPPRTSSSSAVVFTKNASPGVKFTFTIYENQRRWLGVGWTSTLFGYERAAWTDEHLQPCDPPSEFQLPEQQPGSGVVWKWVSGEDWHIEGVVKENGAGGVKQDLKDKLGGPGEDGEGWWYYDNKWRDGRKGLDGWGKYTRRRKWYRRAELVECIEQRMADIPDEQPKQETERLEEDERDDGSEEDAPSILITDTDQDGSESVIAEVELPSKKKTPPPLPERRKSPQ